MNSSFWTKDRIWLVSITAIISVVTGIILTYYAAPERAALLTQGDFPSFYAAAKIMRDGLGGQLYSGSLQRAIQHQFWPQITVYYTYFPYPPYFASLLSPLAALPPAPAKLIWDTLMFFCWLASIYLAAKTAPLLKRNPLASLAVMISFTPVLMGILGSQNIPLGMLFYAGTLWMTASGKKLHEYFCGLFLGLWLFKPHYPILIACFFLAAGYYRVLAGFLFVALIYYLIGTAAIRWDWPTYWGMAVKWFSEENTRNVSFKMVSFPGFTRALGDFLKLPRLASEIAGHLLQGVLFGGMLRLFWDIRKNGADVKTQKMLDLLALAGPAVILISPHTLFYDAGICLFSAARFLKLKTDRGITALIFFQLFVILSVGLRQSVPFQPLFFGVLGCFLFIVKRMRDASLRG